MSKEKVVTGQFNPASQNNAENIMQKKQEEAFEYLTKHFKVSKKDLLEWEADIQNFIQNIASTKEAKDRIVGFKEWIEQDQPSIKKAIGLDALFVFVLISMHQSLATQQK